MSSGDPLDNTWVKEVHDVKPVDLFVGSNEYVELLLVETKHLYFFKVRVAHTKLNRP